MIFNILVIFIFIVIISVATWVSARSVFYMYSNDSEEERDIDEMAFHIAENIRNQMTLGTNKIGFKAQDIDKDKEDIGYT